MPLNYPAIAGLVSLHLLALAGIVYIVLYGIGLAELALHGAFYLAGGLGITALYHRAWAHNAVQLARPIEYILAACSTLVVQMPARQWIVAHIEHHKHTDHDKDPYNINNGFWWAHCEWIFFDQKVDQPLPARLAGNPVIDWQHRNYWWVCFGMNIAVPTAVALAVGAPWWSGIVLSCLRMAIMEHVVFSVNSVCHYWGTQPYSKEMTAKDVWWFPFALGEQYHNYHHAFPRDYRHGIHRLDFDPTKWFIDGLARLGWATNLVTMPDETVRRAIASASVAQREKV
jgi:stearoyl-CoA desaturase (delta-9 desaturase)